ncbi:MAG TPA: hypothetical protein VMG32_02400 [Anaeromyxobacteraceae bacterium]|nr:hypothetical protein [Anaeromyxobacteraceae bacterium]
MFERIDRIREQAATTLREIAKRGGRDSVVYADSQKTWRDRERAASLSLVRGDFGRAEWVMREGLEVLVQARRSLGPRGSPLALLRALLTRRDACAGRGEGLAV